MSLLDHFKRLAVWAKGHPCIGMDPAIWRKDDHGNLLHFPSYGDRHSPHGWEIDHHPIPQAIGGSDYIGNLRPLHCSSNASLGGLLGLALSGTKR